MEPPLKRRPFLVSLWRGVRLRCPECGEGRTSISFTTFRDSCHRCGRNLLPGRGEFTGALMLAMGVVMVVGFVGAATLLAIGGLPTWAPAAWLAFFGVVVPILFYRNLKGVWAGFLYAMESR